MKIIEIKGIGIPNKGAELMLHCVLQHFSGNEGVMFVAEPNTGYSGRAGYQLWQKASFDIKGRTIDISPALALIPRVIRRKFGIILDSEVDVIVDASGFAYGDQWGARKARERLGKKIRKWKSAGKKVVLLPQAFGPFAEPAIRKEMEKILLHADVVFARDQKSFEYLDSVLPGKALRSPDFTNLALVPQFPERSDLVGRACVIPNSKMTQMGKISEEDYVSELIMAATVLQDAGMRPFLLLHEGADDLHIAELVNSGMSDAMPIIKPTDALEIKYIIGGCRLVVSSRFHGLVSALSQGVPVVAMGWSHKYEELLADYGVGHYLAAPDARGSISHKVKEILEPTQMSEALSSIRPSVDKQKELVRKMWEVVDTRLG